MTDAQAFSVLLVVLYLFECLTFASAGSQAFVSGGLSGRKWTLRAPLFRLAGFQKSAFLGPLLPWPGSLIVIENPKYEVGPLTARHARSRGGRLVLAVSQIRFLSALVFLHFFIVLPLAYRFLAKDWDFAVVVLYGFFLMLMAAGTFFCVHKRLYPGRKGERWKEFLMACILPWYAMRIADSIALREGEKLSPAGALASGHRSVSNKLELQSLWRVSRFKGEGPLEEAALSDLLEQVGIDPQEWEKRPELESGEVYCPACQSVFVESVGETCPECDVVLRG